MTKQVQRRRGTSTQHTSFTGAEGEISVNTTNKSIHVHDGSTAGGVEAARADLTNVSDANLNAALSGNTLSSLTITSVDINGGTIDGAVIGGSSAAAGTFTTVTASGDVTIADKIVHSGDTNTSIRFPAADTVTVETSGAERLRVDSSGNVGVGQIPNASQGKLQISQPLGSTIDGAIRLTDNATTAFVFNNVSSGLSALWSSGAVAFGTGGVTFTERMRIDSAGNVGIGTSSVSYRLHLNNASAVDIETGVTNSAGTSRFGTRGSGNAFAGAFTAGKSLELWSAGSQAATIDSSGNLGLGVTPSSGMTTIRSMQLGYSGIIAGQQGTAEVLYLGSNWRFDGAFRYQNNGFATRYDTGSGTHAWYTAPSGTAGNAITFTQAMKLDASGNLGIGTSSPSNFAGYSTLSLNNTSGSIVNLFVNGTETGRLQAYSGVLALVTTNASSLMLSTNNSERMRIDPSGNVGINESSPDYRLDVNGAIGFTPGASVTPVDNGDVVFELTNNTTLTIKAKGSDGVVRSATITLA